MLALVSFWGTLPVKMWRHLIRALPIGGVLVVCILLTGCVPSESPSPTINATPSLVSKASSETQQVSPSTTFPDQGSQMEQATLSEEEELEIEWGEEITLDELIEMGQNDQISSLEWHIMPNRVRIITTSGQIFNLRNEHYRVDVVKVLEDAGVKVGKGGIPFKFLCCN